MDILITSTSARVHGKRGFLVSGSINEMPFRGAVDFVTGKALDLVTAFVQVPGQFNNLERAIIVAAAEHAGVVL